MNDTARRMNLPQWARQEMDAQDRIIKNLHAEVDGFKRMLGTPSEDPPAEGGYIALEYGIAARQRLWLPPNQRHVTMQVGDFKLRLTADVQGSGSVGNGRGVQAMVSTHHGLIVRPQSGNLVHLEPGR